MTLERGCPPSPEPVIRDDDDVDAHQAAGWEVAVVGLRQEAGVLQEVPPLGRGEVEGDGAVGAAVGFEGRFGHSSLSSRIPSAADDDAPPRRQWGGWGKFM